ncbi:RNA-binding protein Musashi-like protein 2 [Acropora cervicornis]|uniref:RNA-binding protein Musashi-like protein 2 n=1 Tax=Acropora cervicornis TaxID=6130 RepID=A0AAD9QN98_ACRCE|nr:RNA-binding protein Musashi-like protein 2 [Acropora cervicornis]
MGLRRAVGLLYQSLRKIFVGGLSTETTKESLLEYFSTFGEVADCIVMKDSVSKRSRGFGFVTFSDASSVDNIDPKRAVPRGPGQQAVIAQQNSGAPVVKDSGGNENKIFVGGLGGNTTEEELKRFFSVFGKVVHVKLMYDKETSRMRGKCFLVEMIGSENPNVMGKEIFLLFSP